MEMTNEHTQREAQRLQACREELVERILKTVPADGDFQLFKGMHVARVSTQFEKFHSVFEASFCVIAQGSKEVLLGDQRYVYDSENYLITTLDLPRVSQVLEASKERPYLSFRFALDPQLVSAVMVESGQFAPPRNPVEMRAIDVSPLDANLLDAVVRLVRLQDTPSEAPILMPMIVREIIYRLLKGSQGGRLSHLTMIGGYTPDIARAVQIIRQNFDQPLRIEQLAHELGMSVSGFHYHFKAVTAMSPLQFQKQLRLQEARRLLLSENLDATSAAFRVGYNDAAHFNREYKSVFGIPPMRDVQRIREAVSAFPG
jgi:AraC-like DNA-binding protein